MGKNSNGKEIGKGIRQKPNGLYEARYKINGVSHSMSVYKINELKSRIEIYKSNAK